jgi:calcineurin-like phosphoesterase family protein
MLAALAAGPVRAGDFEFVVIGDTRPRFESQDFRPFEGLIAKINAVNPALVINLGDLIYGYGPRSKERQWDKYQQVIKEIGPPYYQLPGNHDTHSKEARKIYGRRFGRFYQSFDYQDCHFVLLDNTERERWGYLGPAQLEWLKTDLKHTRARSVFVFLHFPVWEPERITPEYHEFWAQNLHPLFNQSRVRAVFAGHFHAYGPTREFDGIRYFITGGGGAELRPEYKKSGGEHHFMRVKVSGDAFDVRVVTERGELSDPEADVMGGLQFAARNVSRIGIKPRSQDLREGVNFSVSIDNPYQETLTGHAEWVLDASAFSVEPREISLQIPAGGKQQHNFTLKAFKDTATLQSLPRLGFNLVAGGHHHRFHREVRLLEEIAAPYRRAALGRKGQLADWEGVPSLKLGQSPKLGAELRASYDAANLYLAVDVPLAKSEEEEELGFPDDLQIGFARRLSNTDFGADLLRLGLSSTTAEAQNRTAGRKFEGPVPGVTSTCRTEGGRTSYEIAIPLRLLKHPKAGTEDRLILDLCFALPDGGADATEPADPTVNTFAYRVRYGNDSLVPVHFIELTLERK